uniref:Polycomb protein Sfmbt n=1 Tax=Cacopsylla melanoneura TaxID=428564 RepID=A0A8D9A729_9HEMI
MDMATRETDMGGYIWMGDMIMPSDPSELMMDAQMDTSFFTEAHLEEMRVRQSSIDGYMMLEELEEGMYYEAPAVMSKMSTNATHQTNVNSHHGSNRKIKPVKHPGLKLQTPIAYQKDTDPNVIPIQKDGMAICEKCGAMGVKHAFYTRERRFCSLACARGSQHDNDNANNNSNTTTLYESTTNPIPPCIPQFNIPPSQTFVPSHPINEELRYDESDQTVRGVKDESLEDEEEEEDSNSTDSTPSPYHVPPIPPLSPEEPMFPPDRKSHPELASSYDWASRLNDPTFVAAPVYNFQHAPMSDCWENISVGMKVEVENTDTDTPSGTIDNYLDSFWVASVTRIAGYKALLRYEGFGEDGSKDFWVNLCSSSVHPVGWCATRGKPLIPPRSIETKYSDWKQFLVKRLTGARTLPSNFYHRVQESVRSRFRVDMNLEVVDKKRISQVKVATIEKIVGKRLQVRYYDDDDGFCCHQDSPLIHPVGWARRTGHLISAPAHYTDRCTKGIRDRDDATEDLFPLSVSLGGGGGGEGGFKVGMKLESVDPLNLSDICVATVMQVLNDKFMMIRVNSYDDENSAGGSDWFCYHMSSPYIFAPGFCAAHGINLTPPKGYTQATFTWDQYCRDTNSVPAPPELFHQTVPDHQFHVGMRLESADLMNPALLCVGTICRLVGRLLRVHFDGWEDEFDQWIDCESCDIYPVGWCELVSHRLEPPRPPVKPGQPKQLSKGRKPKKKGGRWAKRGGLTGAGPKIETSSASTMSPNSFDHLSTSSFPSPQALGEVAPFRSSNTWDEYCSLSETATPPVSNSTSTTSEKEIPCLSSSQDSQNYNKEDICPAQWSTEDVGEFLKKNDCAAYCDNFAKQKINGEKLLTLTKEECFDLTGMKAGPSIKIAHLITCLNKIVQNPNRFKSALKKPLL